ncbi:MAG: ABC transporter permease [Phycisphaeraceae bacterium]|nr:ABC transporter permease [Phycisphaeraceae bacterium]
MTTPESVHQPDASASPPPEGEGPWDRVIRARSGLVPVNFAELWRYRELFWFMAWREVTIRYKQTALGILWALIQPLMTMVVFTVLYGHLAGFAADSPLPYALVTMCGVVVWQFFADGISRSGQSLVAQSSLVTKVYFPRLIVPTTSVISSAVDLAVAMVILLPLLMWFRIAPTMNLLLLPVFASIAMLAALGTGLWLSALNVKYRDIKHIIPFLVRLGLLVSPVGFLSSKISPPYRFWFSLNPMVGVIDGFRWCLLGPAFEPYWPGFWVGLVTVLVVLVTGAYYFKFVERTFADVV